MSEPAAPQVGLGCHVEVELIDAAGGRERVAFDLVADRAADFAQGRLSVNTPLGQAIRGKRAGAVVPYAHGELRQVQIIAVRPGGDPTPDDAAARRAAVLEEARRKAERTNADMFASSFSSKWGNYSTEEMDDES